MITTISRATRFLTLEQVAALLDVHVKTVRRKISAGELRAHFFGRRIRISEDDYARYVASKRK